MYVFHSCQFIHALIYTTVAFLWWFASVCSFVKCLWCVCLNSVVSLYARSPSELQVFITYCIPAIAVCLEWVINQTYITVCNVRRLTGQQLGFCLQSLGFVHYLTLEQLDVIPCSYHIGKNRVDCLHHISVSMFSLSSSPCAPIIILIAIDTREQVINFTLRPRSHSWPNTKEDLCCWLTARRRLLYTYLTLRWYSAYNFTKYVILCYATELYQQKYFW